VKKPLYLTCSDAGKVGGQKSNICLGAFLWTRKTNTFSALIFVPSGSEAQKDLPTPFSVQREVYNGHVKIRTNEYHDLYFMARDGPTFCIIDSARHKKPSHSARVEVCAMTVTVTVFLALALVSFSLASGHEDDIAPQVVGGEPAQPHEFPFLVALLVDDAALCGGTLIRADVVRLSNSIL